MDMMSAQQLREPNVEMGETRPAKKGKDSHMQEMMDMMSEMMDMLKEMKDKMDMSSAGS